MGFISQIQESNQPEREQVLQMQNSKTSLIYLSPESKSTALKVAKFVGATGILTLVAYLALCPSLDSEGKSLDFPSTLSFLNDIKGFLE
ncbi:hypothetical protein DB42_BD00440 [Neochlamydia sp. EPS4]|jgi:hypothetical protein|uniref:hypothetical protein n=1 Tax=Neochlamydia sp. EPS4 TaxID=1478175 RepID=UPI000583A837|nr:hypothetical protein [Neochlamydia sp. EPS4]KIC74496.1 hypothetical protein DB42_BD00440 [Neochlamydia sp. EPS4]